MSDTKDCLMITLMKAAQDLISTHNGSVYEGGLSNADVRTRMLRISDDLVYACDECDYGILTADQTDERLGNIQIEMERARRILATINRDYDVIRADRHDRGIDDLYRSDISLQMSLMSLTDAILSVKYEILKWELEDE